jgi:solute:Na+ symporter, SSS family
MTLTWIDWVIIAAYLVGCMGAGIWMRRFVRGVEDFAVAAREMDLNVGIASLAATEVGLVTVMYAAQLGYEKGFAGATVGLLMAAAMYLVGRTGFIIEPLRRAGVLTIPQLFEQRFGTRVRWLAGLFVVLGGVLNMGIFLRVGGDFLVHTTGMGERHLEWVMTALLGLVLLYTVLGGMLSVLVTDYLQFLVMGLGIVVTSVLVIGDTGWTHLIQELWSHWKAGAARGTAATAANPFNPLAASSLGWGYVVWQAMFQLAVVTTWQTQISRVLSAKDAPTAKRMYRRSAFYFVGRFALPGLWGIAALVHFHFGQTLPAGADSLTAMPAYLGTLLPAGLLGILIAAMLAAEMSTDSGYLLTWATVIYNDLVMPCLKRPLTARARLLVTRALVLAIGLFLVFYGLWYQLPGRAWDYLAVTGNIYLASVFTLLVACLYWPAANAVGAVAALILGALGPVGFLLISIFVTEAHRLAPAFEHAHAYGLGFLGAFLGAPEVSGLLSFGLAALGMLVGSRLGRRAASASSPEATV